MTTLNNEDTKKMNGSSNKMAERCFTPPLSSTTSSSSSAFSTPGVDPAIKEIFTNVTPPKIRLTECVRLSQVYGITWDECTVHGQRVLSFLFDRRVHKVLEEDYKDNVKENVMKDLVGAMNPDSSVGERVSVLLYERGQSFFPNVPSDVQTYDDFLEKCPHWKPSESIAEPDTFFNLLAGPVDFEVFQQVQLSGNCYLHGAVSVYQYLYRWHNIKAETHLIDIPRYMRHTFNEQDIRTHLFRGTGGRSENILRKLAGEKVLSGVSLAASEKERTRDCLSKMLLQHVKLFGPQLLASVVLSDDFGEDETCSYHGAKCSFPPIPPPPEDDNRVRHSLVLLGLQKVGNDWVFLFQNWHKSTQFFEADYDWVVKSEGKFWSVMCDQGTWKPPSLLEPYYAAVDDFAVYAEASPGVDKSGNSDDTTSFSYSTGCEHQM